MTKKILFLTGTRADFGKLKPLIHKMETSPNFQCHIFVTGMHMLSQYGSTFHEVLKEGYRNIYPFNNQNRNTDMDIVLSNTIIGLSNFTKELQPDIIIVHGDRTEALAGAIVGALNNILVGHIEGGEVSGTIDEVIRHTITKMSHIHFVANEKAKKRVLQLGEKEESVFIIGSPDLDIMKSQNLPKIAQVKKYYDIPFEQYAIFCYHSVTTELSDLSKNIDSICSSLIESRKNYVVIYPNNDPGSDVILRRIEQLQEYSNFRILPSMRFEYFLSLLKNAQFIIGNSSAGIREAGYFCIPSINIGNRQKNRSKNKSILHVNHNREKILDAIMSVQEITIEQSFEYGDGQSAEKFVRILNDQNIWKISCQKYFVDAQE